MYEFRPITPTTAHIIAHWQYPPPYNVYNGDPNDIEYLLDPSIALHSIHDNAELIGFVAFGSDGQVAGGDYSAEALDIGAGMRPDLTGRGNGLTFINTIIDFAIQTFNPPALRATLAVFNQRVQHVCIQAGFTPVSQFISTSSQKPFVIMLKRLS